MNFDTKGIAKAFLEAKIDGIGQVGVDVMDDFTPGSAYYQKWLSEKSYPRKRTVTTTETRIKTPGYWQKVCMGYIILVRWVPVKKYGITIYQAESYRQPIYAYYYVKPVYETISKAITVQEMVTEKPIPENIPILVYAGTNNDLLGMLVSEFKISQTTMDDIQKWVKTYENVTGAATIWHTSAAAMYVGLGVVSALLFQPEGVFAAAALAICHTACAINAGVAWNISRDINGTYNDRLLNAKTNGSDAFMPVDAVNPLDKNGKSKYGGKAFTGASDKYILKDTDLTNPITKAPPSWNHITIQTDDTLWGPNPGSVSNPQKAGHVYDILKAEGMESYTDNWVYWNEKKNE